MKHPGANELFVWLESNGLSSALANARMAYQKTGDSETALDALLVNLDPSLETGIQKRIVRRYAKKKRSMDSMTPANPDRAQHLEVEYLDRPEPVTSARSEPATIPVDESVLPEMPRTAGKTRSWLRRLVIEGVGSLVILATTMSIFGSMTHGNSAISLIAGLAITGLCWGAVLRE